MATKKILDNLDAYYIFLGKDVAKRVQRVTLNTEEIWIHVGQTYQFQYTVFPKDALFAEITWTSSDPSIADVDEDGNVTGYSEGICSIAVEIGHIRFKAKCHVASVIEFKDPLVKQICVSNWDKDFDGELSYAEAAAVKAIPYPMFTGMPITSFDELTYFTGVKTIAPNAFNGCTSLNSIVIPENCERIGKNAFSYTAISYINIPLSVERIGNGAFSYTPNLSDIHCDSPVPATVGTYIFEWCPSLDKILVPSASADDYCAAENWYEYRSYINKFGFDYIFDFHLG